MRIYLIVDKNENETKNRTIRHRTSAENSHFDVLLLFAFVYRRKKTLKLRPTKISTINSHDLKSASDSKLLWLLLVLLFCFLSRLENVVRHHFCIIIKNWTTALMRMHHSQSWINLFIYESRKTLVCWSPFCLTTQSSAIGNNRTEIDLCPRRRWLWCAQDKQHATREFEVPHWEIACTRIE